MDWMYKGVSGVVDRENYLTGRKIDKSFELLELEENPNSFKNNDYVDNESDNQRFQSNQIQLTNESKIDIDTKMREDPLFQIQMKQIEQRKKMLDNPLHLNKLKKLLQSSIDKDKMKKHKKKSKKKCNKDKKIKSSKYSESSSSDSSDSQDSSSSSKSHDRDEERRHHKSKESYSRQKQDNKYLLKSNIQSTKTKMNTIHRKESFSRYNKYSKLSNDKHSKLSEKERERKLKEMMSNAEWREQTRYEHVKRINEKEKFEELSSKELLNKSSDFIRPIITKLNEKDSIEDSLKRRQFKLQRGSKLDTNFTKR